MKYEICSIYGRIDVVDSDNDRDALHNFARSKGFKGYDQDSFRKLGVLEAIKLPINRRMNLIAKEK